MPIPEAAAKRQIERFADFAQFPETEAGIRELVKAFVAAARDERQAEAIGDRLMRTLHFCPKPVEVFEAGDATREPDEPQVEEWCSNRRPGDQPFGGFHELVDDRVLAILRCKAQQEKASIERESARRFLRSWEPKKAPGLAAGDAR